MDFSKVLCFYRYEMSNCLFEATFENILETCKCFPGFHTMGGEEAMEKFDICMGENLTCMNELLNKMGMEKLSYLSEFSSTAQVSLIIWNMKGSG